VSRTLPWPPPARITRARSEGYEAWLLNHGKLNSEGTILTLTEEQFAWARVHFTRTHLPEGAKILRTEEERAEVALICQACEFFRPANCCRKIVTCQNQLDRYWANAFSHCPLPAPHQKW
jgi:hypothetical protein